MKYKVREIRYQKKTLALLEHEDKTSTLNFCPHVLEVIDGYSMPISLRQIHYLNGGDRDV